MQISISNAIGGGGRAQGSGSSFENVNSFTFDGNSDYVDMGNVLDFTNTDAFSISCWFKRTRSGVSEFLVAKQERNCKGVFISKV